MSLTSPIRPLYQAQTYRNLLFLAAGIPIAAVVLGLVIAGWTSIAVLAITLLRSRAPAGPRDGRGAAPATAWQPETRNAA